MTPSIPAGRCVGALWVAQFPSRTYRLSCGSSSQVHIGSFHIYNTYLLLFDVGVCWMMRDYFVFRLAQNRSFFPLHIACNFESYAAHGTPPISAVGCQKQKQQKTPRAQQCSARRVFLYHALTESSKSSTTGQPRNRIYIRVEKAEEAALGRK